MDVKPASPEEVLSQAFDHLTHDPDDIAVGLKAIDEYLALVCSPVPIYSPVATKSKSVENKLSYPTSPWIKEFRKLQDGFQYNIAQRLIACIDSLLTAKNSQPQDSLITSCLECLQGTLLLHPESRNLFARQIHMATFIELLTRRQPPELRVLTIDTLVCTLLECPANMRTFESLNGLQTIATIFKTTSTPSKIRLRITEFLYFYLLPENESSQRNGYSSAQVVKVGKECVMGPRVRSIQQKEEMLGRHLKGIEGIVMDIRGYLESRGK
ncbi:60S ribosomal protein L3 [Arthrobotrys megalospora]